MNGQENGSNVNPSSVDAVTESRDFSTNKNETATIKINNGNAINADKNKTGAGFKKKPTRHLIFEGYEGGKRIAKKEVGANVVEE